MLLIVLTGAEIPLRSQGKRDMNDETKRGNHRAMMELLKRQNGCSDFNTAGSSRRYYDNPPISKV